MGSGGLVPKRRNFGLGWLLLGLTFAVHTADEATHSFLVYYNATVLTLYGHFSWFPRLDLEFHQWLYGLLFVNLLLLSFTPLAYRNVRWLRPAGYVSSSVFFGNGIWHLLLQIFGSPVPSVRIEGADPGIYSAPLLLIASGFLFWQLKRSSRRA